MTLTRKLGITALIIYTLVVSVVRELNTLTPNNFAEAHWLLDYRFGFVKRGLIGEIVSLLTGWLSIPITAQLIFMLSTAMFLIFCVAIIVLSIHIVQRTGWCTGGVLVALVFLSSPFIVISPHLIGYYDNIIIVLGLFSVLLLLKGRPWLGAWLLVLALLIHENSLFLSVAPFCLAWLLINSKRKKVGMPLLPFLPLLLPVCAFLVIAANHDLFIPQNFVELFTAHLSQFPFLESKSNTTVPYWIAGSFLTYYTEQSLQFAERISSAALYGLILPSTLAILLFTVSIYRIRNLSLETVVLAGFCFAPQLMHLIAWDTTRIWTYTILCAFLALWIYLGIFTPHEEASASRLLCLAALVANVMMHAPHVETVVDQHTLVGRLLLYTPVLVGSLALILSGGSIAVAERLSIQGSAIFEKPAENTKMEPDSLASAGGHHR